MNKPNIKKIAIFSKKDLKISQKFLLNIIKFLEINCKEVFIDENTTMLCDFSNLISREKALTTVDMIISLGGDGTLLNASHHVDAHKKVLFLGVNFGTLGFLSEIKEPHKLIDALVQIFQGYYHIDERVMLRVTVNRNKKKVATFLALNDAVINQGNLARLMKLRVDIDRRKVAQFKADGLVIATPTGSTAHSMSAGGPIVHPSLATFVMTPICPVTLTNRPILLPNHQQIKVHIITEREEGVSELGLTIDGQNHFTLKYGDQINIRKSSRSLYLVKILKESYYKNLRTKIGWAM